mgnify:CR=1 FL=1
MKTIKLFMAIFICALIFTSCKKNSSDPSPYDGAVMSKGGIMYDKFWTPESGFDQNNQYMGTFTTLGNFFRCKQCHAWDGLGNAGSYISRAPKTTRPNVSSLNLYQLTQTKTPQELFDGLKATANRRAMSYDLSSYDPETNHEEGDKMPNLNEFLTDAEMWNIVKFMKEGMFNVANLYDGTYTGTYPTGTATYTNIGLNGNAETGKAYYTANCASCHGADGTTLDLEGKTLGKFTRSKPNEVQHKVKYGQPGSTMTGMFDATVTEVKDLYKAIANTDDFPDEVPATGDGALGGIMYDKFWTPESGFDQSHQYMDVFTSSSNFFRCKQCHAWDGLGNAGSYISRAPKTTRPNVSSLNLYELAQTKTAQELFDGMKATDNRRDITYDLASYDPATNHEEGDKMPNMNQIFTDEEMWNMVKFMKDGMFDVSELYVGTYTGTYPTGSATFTDIGLDGDAAAGNSYYTANCASCHGDDGTTLIMEDKTLGKFLRSKPNEVQHKVKYGQPGSDMTPQFEATVTEVKNLYKACADTVAFPN